MKIKGGLLRETGAIEQGIGTEQSGAMTNNQELRQIMHARPSLEGAISSIVRPMVDK